MKSSYEIVETDNKEFPYNVQEWFDLGNGTSVYSGRGKFCRNKEEAVLYILSRQDQQ